MSDSLDEETVREIVRDELGGPTRRDALKAGGALGLGGLLGIGGYDAATRSARAGTAQVGTLGAANEPVDVVAEDIYGPGGQGSNDAVAFEAVETATVVDADDGTIYDVGNDLAGGGGGHADTQLFFVGDYSGSSLDVKISNILASSEYENRTGARIIIHPPAPGDAARTTDPSGTSAAWKWDSQLDLGADKLTFEVGWTQIVATSAINSFIRIGANEKRENITINGGFWYADSNLSTAHFLLMGLGHGDLNDCYLQSLNGRDTVPAGIRVLQRNAVSELTVRGVEVTGATNAFHGSVESGSSGEVVMDFDMYDFRGGGGTNAVYLEGGFEAANLQSIQTGGTPTQSVDNAIIKMDNQSLPQDNLVISNVREEHNDRAYNYVVEAVATNGTGDHQGIYIDGVDFENAANAADMGPVGKENSEIHWGSVIRKRFDTALEYWFQGSKAFNIGSYGAGNGEFKNVTPGAGWVCRTPDDTADYRIRVDNNGNVVTDLI